MNRIALSIIVALAATLVAPLAIADAPQAHHEAMTIAAKEAQLTSAALTEKPEMIKDLAKSLATHKGILGLKHDAEAKLLRVVFDPGVTSTEALQKALTKTLPDLELAKVEDTTWEPKDCGKCPSAAKCKGEKKAE